MLGLPRATWERLIIWMVIGIVALLRVWTTTQSTAYAGSSSRTWRTEIEHGSDPVSLIRSADDELAFHLAAALVLVRLQ